MRLLDQDRAKYLMRESDDPMGRLATYSTKLDRMLANIETSKGSNLVYSQFKTVEGLGVLGIALARVGLGGEVHLLDDAPQEGRIDVVPFQDLGSF
jgi:hypothetical protein